MKLHSSHLRNRKLRWLMRIVLSMVLATVLGALPVYINSELSEIRKMRSELRSMKKLNQRLFVDLEDSSVRLDTLRTKAGMERLMREKGFAPEDSLVYQFE
ncbi:MAG: hypothetical protein JXR95_05150 [Deltaproteobacteria bacterium]|nr:hypothetical protein [Deltaproteobacteria bacterium]